MKRAAKADVAAVFDSSPLIFLSRIRSLREASSLYSESLIPETVKAEVIDIGKQIGAPETAEIEALLQAGDIKVMTVPETALSRRLETNKGLSTADRDSIVLALERNARLLADDAAVRTVAEHLGIPLGGTLSVLFSLVDAGVMTASEGGRNLDRLIDEGWYCSAKLYRMARRALERA
jgi:predicted nucleic acid-binding protein